MRLPVLFLGAALFWTTALGLGGWSMTAVTAFTEVPESDAPCSAAVDPEDEVIMVELKSEAGIPIRFQAPDVVPVRAPAYDVLPGPAAESDEAPAPSQDSIGRTAF